MAPSIEKTDAAGSSAQLEYDRRAARQRVRDQRRIDEDVAWRASLRERRPIIGRIVTAVAPRPQFQPEPQSTTAWKVGAEGERQVAEALSQVPAIEVLHDRLIPGSKANIDHVAVAAGGVYVIDAKKYTGKVEVRDVGGLFRTDLRLYVNGRDRTRLIAGVEHQVDVVRGVLAGQFSDVPVHGILCFVGCEWGVRMRPKRLRDVVALWPQELTKHLAAAGSHADAIEGLSQALRSALRPAVRS